LGERTDINAGDGQVFYTGRARNSWVLRFLHIFQVNKLLPKWYDALEDTEYSRRINFIIQSKGWSNLPLLVIKDFTSIVPSLLRKQRVLSVIHQELTAAHALVRLTSKHYFTNCWAVSNAASNSAIKQGYMVERCVPNPLDVTNLIQRANEISSPINAPYLLFVGNLSQAKGIFELLDAYCHMNKDYDLLLVYVGEGKDRDELQRRVKLLGMIEKVLILGFQANPYPYIQKAKVLVLPSKSEAMGYTPLEAAALGVPFVVSGFPAAPEFFSPDAIVPLNDNHDLFINALACKLEQLLQSPGVYIKQNVLESMSLENVAHQYIEMSID
jgi:glycosyltransferase involved in cell wall biosynthesis